MKTIQTSSRFRVVHRRNGHVVETTWHKTEHTAERAMLRAMQVGIEVELFETEEPFDFRARARKEMAEKIRGEW